MKRRLWRIVLGFVAIEAAVFAVGQVLSRRMSVGDDTSDVFRLAALAGGRQFASRSDQLKSGSALAAMGGIDMDLRGASLASDGAHLDLRATMGGIRVVVPAEWDVHVDAVAMAGGCDVRVTPQNELPDDAPRLSVHAVARMGGIQIVAG